MVSTAERGHEVPVAVRAAPTEVPETKNVVHRPLARESRAGKNCQWLVTDFEAGSRKVAIVRQSALQRTNVTGVRRICLRIPEGVRRHGYPQTCSSIRLEPTHSDRLPCTHRAARRAAVRTFGPGFMDRSRVSCPSTCGEHSGDAGVQGQGEDRTREMQSGSGAGGLSRRAIKRCARAPHATPTGPMRVG